MMRRKIAGQVSLEDLERICPILSRRNHPEFEGERQLEVEVAGVRFGAGVPVVIARSMRSGKRTADDGAGTQRSCCRRGHAARRRVQAENIAA